MNCSKLSVNKSEKQKLKYVDCLKSYKKKKCRLYFQYVEREPSMSSLKVRAEKEKELVEAETYWKDRLHKMEHEVSWVVK